MYTKGEHLKILKKRIKQSNNQHVKFLGMVEDVYRRLSFVHVELY